MMEKPFIHLFKTPGAYYLFDVNKNIILAVSRTVYHRLKKILEQKAESYNQAKLDESDVFINNLREQGLLKPSPIKEIVHPASDKLEYYLEARLSKITLQLTQQCNLRCDYCVYSGSYLNRTHSNKRMSFETAQKAIDLFLKHTYQREEINFGFYGGEPLLEFQLIKQCVAYIKENTEGKNTGFAITTNGTLFNDEIISFLSSNDFSVLISLDGPKTVHNKNRRFAANDCGSFDTIIDNLDYIIKKYPGFVKNVSFNVVLDPENDFSCTNDFFMNFEMFKSMERLSVNASVIADNYIDDSFRKSNDNFRSSQEYEEFKIFLSKLVDIAENEISILSRGSFEQLVKMNSQLKPGNYSMEKCHHGGPCIPGQRKLFVDTEGYLFPCERVSESSEMMKIGHVETGISLDKAQEILNIGKITENACKNCWAINYCYLCAAFADNTEEFSKKVKMLRCKQVRYTVEEKFKDICVLKEMGYNFDDSRDLMEIDL